MTRIRFVGAVLLSVLITACGGDSTTPETGSSAPVVESAPASANVTQERLLNAASEPEQWLTYGGTYQEQRFSRLGRINKANVDRLGLAWFADLDTNRGQQSTPLFIDGVLYITEAWSHVKAFDARSGEELWHYNPQVPGEFGGRGCCDVVNRGVAAWNGKIYVAAYDGRLIALDADSGEEVWSTVTTDQSQWYSITGAPRVANGKVFIGNAGAEYIYRGYISAYDAETGELVWRFHTVPGNPADGFENDAMAMAAQTWDGEWWKYGGGGSTWDGITYDPDTNLLLFGVGNGAPWNADVRSPGGGDNLFTVSIVALDADTGEYRWHFQQIPHEEWDFDATQQIILADIEVNGAERHVAMQATKSGYYYMVDATTGELLVAENFVPVNWTTGYDMATGRPIKNEAAQYTLHEGPRIIQPGPAGAHSWHPASYSPETGWMYFQTGQSSMAFTANPEGSMGNFNLFVDFFGGDAAYEDSDIPRGGPTKVMAWDPVRGEEIWSVERQGASVGTLATAGGLIITGDSGNRELWALDADTGEQLWSYPVQASLSAGAVSYELDGEQYIAQVVGGQGLGGYYAPTYARLLVFKLDGTAQLPPMQEFSQRPINPPEQFATATEIAEGATLYSGACATCHGNGGQNRGMFPDLRRSPLLHSQEAWDQVVLGGIRLEQGMLSFADQMDAEDTRLIRAFIVDLAIQARDNPGSGFGAPTQ